MTGPLPTIIGTLLLGISVLRDSLRKYVNFQWSQLPWEIKVCCFLVRGVKGKDDYFKKVYGKPRSPLQKVFYDLVLFGLNTGMRKSEILELRWMDIKEDEVHVHGKGDRRRTVPLSQVALAVISRQQRRTEYVFDIPNRKQPDLFRRTIAQIRKMTGIDFHFHLLRHYFTTSLLEKGVDFVTIGAILGHCRMATSLIYSHTDKEKTRKTVDSIN